MNDITHQRPDHALHHLLVVDDEEIVLVALRETLRREGYQVSTAPDGPRALELLKTTQFSVIITDQQMPHMTGLEFLAQVKQLQPSATRILVTAVLNLNTVIDAINKGEIYRFIVKPWLREELLVTVENAVQRYELICNNAMLQAATLAMNDQLKQLNRSLEEQVRRVEQQNQALAQNLQRSIELCLQILQTFYPLLGAQARRAQEICRSMAASLQLTPEQVQTLEMAACLHDVGLIGVPRRLIKRWLRDPDSLTSDERALIEQHPVLGQELAGFVHQLEGVGATIRAHHERFDGTGYPDQLAGDHIPWLARLLAVAVSYTESQRTPLEAVEAIKQGSGTRFDPDAVRAFLRSLPNANRSRKEREVLLSELQPGMVVAKGIYTANGLLLIPEGQQLNEVSIDKIKNHNRVNPIAQTLLVYC